MSAADGETCLASAYECICRDPAGHPPPHTCKCGGQWTGGGGDFEVVRFPELPFVGPA